MSGSIKINGNVAAAAAARRLRTATRSLEQVLERLTTGLRINRPSDDAASLSISENLRADARVLNQGLRNLNDAISVLDVAENAVRELDSILARQQELAQEAANGTLQREQRLAIQQEMNALVDEYNRIVESAEYNGRKLFVGDDLALTAQAGYSQITTNLGSKLQRPVGDGTYQDPVSYAVGTRPDALVTADFNGDGRDDVATANRGTNSISVLLSNPDGTLQPAVTYTTETNPIDIAALDVNNDGVLDIVTADYGATGLGDTASIFLGNGDGTFQPRTTVNVGLGPLSLAAGDVNNDGAPDIIAGSASVNFTSGLPEITTIATPQNGRVQITNITFPQAAVREVSSLTAVAGATGTAEVTTIVADAIATHEVTELTMEEGANIVSGSYFTVNSPGASYYVWYNVDGLGVDPGAAGTGIEVAINSTDTADEVAAATAAALDGLADFSASDAGATVTVTNTTAGAAVDAADFDIGGAFAVNVTTQGTDSDIGNGDYFTIDSPEGSYYVWFDIGNTGIDPGVAGRTGIEIDVNYGDSADAVAAAISAALDGLPDFNAGAVGDSVTVDNASLGAVADATLGSITGGTFAVSVATQGVDSDIQSGDYFFISSPSTNYYVWFNVDGQGGDPGIAGRTGIEIAINSNFTVSEVADAIADGLDALADFTASAIGANVTITNTAAGAAADISDQTVGGGFSVGVATQGVNSIIQQSDYFTIDSPSNGYYVWFNIEGGGVDPMVAGRTGLQVNINYGDSAAVIAAAVAAVLEPLADFNASAVGAVTTVTNTELGPGASNQGTVTGLNINVTQTGQFPPIVSGQYFELNSPTTGYYVWYNVDGAGGDPTPGGRTGIQVNINSGDSAAAVAAATAAAIDAFADFIASSAGANVTVTNTVNGTAADGVNVNVGGGLAVNVTQGGSATRVDIVSDEIFAPLHGLTTGTKVQLTTDGSLPGGLNPSTDYYIIRVDQDTIKFASSLANAMGGIAVDITSFGVGTHSIAVAGNETGASLILGNGDGTFQPRSDFSIGVQPESLTLGDINADGNLDLVSVDAAGNSVDVSLGNGDGTFQAPTSLAVGVDPRSIALADINNDGNLDILAANYGGGSGNSVSLLLGKGDGTFAPQQTFNVGSGPAGIALGDLNNDGIPDAVTTDYGDGTGSSISVLLANHEAAFSPAASFAVEVGPTDVSIGDFNGDGVADLAVTSWDSGSGTSVVSVLMANLGNVPTMQRIDVTTQDEAIASLEIISATKQRVSEELAVIGAGQSRLAAAFRNLQQARLGVLDAESVIVSADIAYESAKLAAAKVLQQSAMAVLAQAKREPLVAMGLLRASIRKFNTVK